MRLLKASDLGFELQPPVIRAPRYAILSHTWGDDEYLLEEVQLAGFVRNDFPGRPAVRKVRDTCALAAREGYAHVWIDTCCIDKTNSTELSEAINSMFLFYAESEVCYVYLSDVPDDDAIQRRNSGFRESRWFKRGWTLQELLAPREVRFYSVGWHFLGTRSDLKDLISSITKIPVDVLAGKESWPYSNRSLGEMLSWASMRETSIQEDMAYSLLGILDVNMPPLYGEGPKAFLRLQEELLRRYDDESIFAWEATPTDARVKPYFGLLAPSVAYFHGSHRFRRSQAQTRLVEQPITLSNKGISVQLPLIQSDHRPDVYYALLDCRIEGTNDTEVQPAIRVRCLSKNQFARLDVHHVLDFDFARQVESERDAWHNSPRPVPPMFFPYQPQTPLPIRGVAVRLHTQSDNKNLPNFALNVAYSHPEGSWKGFGSGYMVLNLDDEAPRFPIMTSAVQPVQTTILGMIIATFSEETGAIAPIIQNLVFGLHKFDKLSDTTARWDRAWCRFLPDGHVASQAAMANALKRPMSELQTEFKAQRSSSFYYNISIKVEPEQMLGIVMHTVRFFVTLGT